MFKCLLCSGDVRRELSFATVFESAPPKYLCVKCHESFVKWHKKSASDANYGYAVDAVFILDDAGQNYLEKYVNLQDDELAVCFTAEIRSKCYAGLTYLTISDEASQLLKTAGIPFSNEVEEIENLREWGLFCLHENERKERTVKGNINHVLLLFMEM
ncbi:hypothetical protein MFLO_12873 [Listeria floridensis FSL S10-1187]|uniref:ClpX-type ZB domain-containing protein n=1 Tax=Listeria floridensis FSL S10-1187 TaxID=1265817 RepID=A0ABN0RD09_9LIST|nr:hypothetical protein [Listeria floridensis]EUJ27927.1 hypothetical protein MFLO_12873 [Listeria floridensis FSL S10-1187]